VLYNNNINISINTKVSAMPISLKMYPTASLHSQTEFPAKRLVLLNRNLDYIGSFPNYAYQSNQKRDFISLSKMQDPTILIEKVADMVRSFPQLTYSVGVLNMDSGLIDDQQPDGLRPVNWIAFALTLDIVALFLFGQPESHLGKCDVRLLYLTF
jgi:hypothetical protein